MPIHFKPLNIMTAKDFKETVSFEWLQTEPLEKELSQNKDGSLYMGIDVVKPMLRTLDQNFSTKNFFHSWLILPDGKVAVTGSVELCLKYTVLLQDKTRQEFNRVITGSATFDTQKYYEPSQEDTGNFNWGPICLSLCIVNAAKEIGPRFGMNLNKQKQQGEPISKESEDKIRNTLANLKSDILNKKKTN